MSEKGTKRRFFFPSQANKTTCDLKTKEGAEPRNVVNNLL